MPRDNGFVEVPYSQSTQKLVYAGGFRNALAGALRKPLGDAHAGAAGHDDSPFFVLRAKGRDAGDAAPYGAIAIVECCILLECCARIASGTASSTSRLYIAADHRARRERR